MAARFTLALLAVVFLVNGVFFGLSPLMLPISRRLLSGRDGSGVRDWQLRAAELGANLPAGHAVQAAAPTSAKCPG